MSGVRNVVSIPVSVDLTIANTVAAYTAGKQIGAVMRFPVPAPFLSGNEGQIVFLQSLAAVDPDNQVAAMDLLFFRDAITDVGNGGAFAPSVADAQKFVGRIAVVGTDWTTYGSRAVAFKTSIGAALRAVGGVLYVAVVCQGTPTYATASGLRVKLAGIQS